MITLYLSLFHGFLIGIAVMTALHYRKRLQDAQKIIAKNLDVDLDLATTEQLMIELRKRPNTYLMLWPLQKTDQEGSFGLSIETHGLDAVASCGVLKIAAHLTEKDLRSKGFTIPDLPDIINEVEEDGEEQPE